MDPEEPPPPLRLEVVAEPPVLVADVRAALLAHPVVRTRYASADLWLVHYDALDKAAGEGEGDMVPFRAVLADMAGTSVVEAEGVPWDLDSIVVIPTSRPRLPSEDEHAWALDVLRADPDLAARLDAGEVEAYRPLPPLANEIDADGSVMRAVTVGLRDNDPKDGTPRHRVVAVRSQDGDVLDAAGAPGLPAPSDRECGVADGPCPMPPGAGAEQARVRVWQGDDLLWDLVVVRPSASSGANGSGVELRHVSYRGQKVLHRAHLPIVNVATDGGASSRDWLDEESGFDADGDDAVPGFRTCTTAPQTIVDKGAGGGNFRGVALWLDGDGRSLTIVSQLQAGWNRYVSEWRLHADGTVQPRLRFAATRNPSTCEPHTHHAYWRLDFDVLNGAENLVQENNDPTLPGQLAPWHTIRYEVSRPRDYGRKRQWRVRNVRTTHGYTITPGPDDGVADAFGAGDFWVLTYHSEEIDDAQGVTADPAEARAGIDRFVSSELVEREDVVIWYAAHARHPDGEPGTEVGPDLSAFSWKPPVDRPGYVPLEPPITAPPDDEDDDDYEDEDE